MIPSPHLANKTINISINVFTLKTLTQSTFSQKQNNKTYNFYETRKKNDHFAIKYCQQQTGQIFNKTKTIRKSFQILFIKQMKQKCKNKIEKHIQIKRNSYFVIMVLCIVWNRHRTVRLRSSVQ